VNEFRGLWLVATVALCACPGGDDAGGGDTGSSGDGTSQSASSTATAGDSTSLTTSESNTTATTTVGTTTTDGSSSTTTDPSGSDSGSDGGSTGGGVDANGCPADAPQSWVMCEDFEGIDDPATQLSQWNVAGDAFGVEGEQGDDSDRALRVTLTPNLMFGGWVTLRFGDGPDAPAVDSPDGHFDEVWVRYSLRTGDDWPGYPIGDVGEVISMNGANWGIAADLNLRAEAPMRLHPLVWSCVFGGNLACDGNNDWAGTLQNIWGQEGPTVLFDDNSAGVQRCVVAHMRLNTVGQADGEVDVVVDGVQEISGTGLDLRGSWDDYGINAVRFTNYTNPPAQPLDFWVDDVVVATEPLQCR